MDEQQNPQETQNKKLAIGWFSFTCSEDSTIILTEVLNDHLLEWKKIVDFKHLKALKTHNTLEGIDVAFIEGAISSKTQEDEVKKIRENAKYVVAIGACACTGLPSASRNEFKQEEITERIKWYLSNFDYDREVRKLADVIKVDDQVPGCPMNVSIFLQVLTKYLQLFNIVKAEPPVISQSVQTVQTEQPTQAIQENA